MVRKTRIQIAKPDIITTFEGAPKRVFRLSDINRILADNRAWWRLAQGMTSDEFISFLLQKTKLQKQLFKFPERKIAIYTWGDNIPLYETALALKPNAYLSHYTAAFVHDLTEDIPKTIYVTAPQPLKRREDIKLTQEQIDQAFSRPTKSTKNIAHMVDHRVALLTGMDTQAEGITLETISEGSEIMVTTVERTLIDMVVRPNYAGGIRNVLKAFKLAKGRLSTNKLVATLKRLKFFYPYHQAIGFYMERSGVYSEASLQLLSKLGNEKKFYLDHAMQRMSFDSKWRLFFPKGF